MSTLRPENPGQLVLPLFEPEPARGPKTDRPAQNDHADLAVPTYEQLGQLLQAVVEVATGMRPLNSLRSKLHPMLYESFDTKRMPPISARHRISTTEVHVATTNQRALEICALLREPATKRATAIAACLEPHWSGWRLTVFDFVTQANVATGNGARSA